MDLFFTGLAAFAAGIGVSYINYLFSKKALASEKSMYIFPLRAVLTALFITALYFIGTYTALNASALLIGGALGCTLGLVLFTLILTKKLRSGGNDADEQREAN